MVLLMVTTVQWYGIILIILGLIFRYIVARNRFNRRGSGGLQQYDSYNKALVTTAFERFLKIIGTGMLLFGVFLIAIEWFNKSTTEKYKLEKLKEQQR
ncbi:hypothetical protein [Pedobacter montanisoli]|uniref:Molybdenum ABC transporter permease n=1 Tax=Pedobacter montanisoli TaxID=2923277 RepID=A0ABS9ZYV6_9SPHI|nr:hypothetical protein [Pedobacter montanisoli]MCJ0743487.1 hypothetical protein [Pedobacter montanisoli]